MIFYDKKSQEHTYHITADTTVHASFYPSLMQIIEKDCNMVTVKSEVNVFIQGNGLIRTPAAETLNRGK